MAPTGDKGIRRRKSSRHDRNGCLTCRQRRKKCIENTLPVCGACSRLNLECVRVPRRRLVTEAMTTASEVTKSPFANLYPGWQVDAPYRTKTVLRRHAMRYYINILSQLLTVSTAHNAFVSAFVPMAMESEALSNALIAYAASHICDLDADYITISLHARSRALCGLAKDLSAGCMETNVAACMILLTSEVCDGNYAAWLGHLKGAKQLICSDTEHHNGGVDTLKQTAEGQWLLRNFAYHDILGSVTSGQRPIMSATYLEGNHEVIDTYLGVATQILSYVAAISELDHDEFKDTGNVWLQCWHIRDELISWNCPTTASAGHKSLAHAYRGAALIYLYRKMRDIRPLQHSGIAMLTEESWTFDIEADLRDAVSKTMNDLSSIPDDDPSESAILFPLFLVGGEVTEEHEMDVVIRRLSSMYKKRRFKNILRAKQTLESLWTLRKHIGRASTVRPDWQDMIANQDGGLLLLT